MPEAIVESGSAIVAVGMTPQGVSVPPYAGIQACPATAVTDGYAVCLIALSFLAEAEPAACEHACCRATWLVARHDHSRSGNSILVRFM